MKILKVWFLCCVIAVGSSVAGAWHEDERIQATCEDENALTVINGVTYLCFSMEMIQKMRERTRQGRQA